MIDSVPPEVRGKGCPPKVQWTVINCPNPAVHWLQNSKLDSIKIKRRLTTAR